LALEEPGLTQGCLPPLQARQPKAVQPHLPKCFDGIRSLEFGGESGADILAMLSGGPALLHPQPPGAGWPPSGAIQSVHVQC
jgi:hypothetical protein